MTGGLVKEQTGLRWRQVLVSILATAALAASGCTSLQAVPVQRAPTTTTTTTSGPPASQIPAVQVGEEVQVTRRDGRRETFRVTTVESDALVGKAVRVPYADIAVLKVRRADRDRTAFMVGTVGGIVLAVVLAAVVTDAIFDEADRLGTVAGSP